MSEASSSVEGQRGRTGAGASLSSVRALPWSLSAALAVLLQVFLGVDRAEVVEDAVGLGEDAFECVAHLLHVLSAAAAFTAARNRARQGQGSLFHLRSPFSVIPSFSPPALFRGGKFVTCRFHKADWKSAATEEGR